MITALPGYEPNATGDGVQLAPGYVASPTGGAAVPVGSPAPAAPATVSTTAPTISVAGLSQSQTPVTTSTSSVIPPVPVPPTTPTTPAAPTDPIAQLQSLENEALGKAGDKATSEEDAQAPIQNHIDSLQSLIDQGNANLQLTANKISQSGGYTAFQSRLVANATAANAANNLLLTAQVTALKGDLTTAKQQADDAIEAKYAQVTQDSQTARANIIANFDSMTPDQQAKAEDTLTQLDKTDSFVAEQKANQKLIQTTAITAAANKASAATIQAISNAKTPTEAEAIATAAGVGSGASNTEVHDINGQAVLLNSKTGEVIKTLGASGSTATTNDVVSSFKDAINTNPLLPGGASGHVLDNNGFVTPAAFQAFVANNTPAAVTAIIKDNPTKFYAPGGTIDPSYGFNQTQINALTAALPQQ